MNNIDIFTKEDYENIDLDYPEGYLEECVKTLQQENKQLKEEIKTYQKELEKARIYIQQNIRDIDYDSEEYDYLMELLGDSNE